MAKCFFCDTETHLYSSGEPVCAACSDLLDAGKTPPRMKKKRKELGSGVINRTDFDDSRTDARELELNKTRECR
jgi:hypothetical protein